MWMLSEIVKQVRVVLIDTNSEDLMEEQEEVLLPTVCLQSISSSLIAHFRARPRDHYWEELKTACTKLTVADQKIVAQQQTIDALVFLPRFS
jgi:hypothetical protein